MMTRQLPLSGPSPRHLSPALAFLLLLVLGPRCSQNADGNGNGGPPPETGAHLKLVAGGLNVPLYVTSPPNDPRLFIVEQGGVIRIVEGGRLLKDPFLDVTGLVSHGQEQGLLSMAFHPGYAGNGRFFISYTDGNGDSRVVEYRVSSDPNRAETAPVRTILGVDQPFSNHNGGLILFGRDGKLYFGLGDGGGAGDPNENGQSLGTLLGKILRIDVDSGVPYAIPPDNPFVGRTGVKEEIWAYGLRNPWRFSFDRTNGDIYIADVGQWDWEEVDAITASALGRGGQNYGWDILEGSHCYEPPSNCDSTGLVLPVVEYDHSGQNCSITGGYCYRGNMLTGLTGHYFYADYCAGFVRSFKLVNGRATDERSWPDLAPPEGFVTSFGEDAEGEIYIMSGRPNDPGSGKVYAIVPE